jgi:hypothetical protein
MSDFQAKVYAAEHQARQQYKQLQTRLDIIEQQNQHMKKLVSGKQPQIQYAIPANDFQRNVRYQNKHFIRSCFNLVVSGTKGDYSCQLLACCHFLPLA